ncbi:MAG: GNAT family N-acetyltransferase [Parvularculaceae bacterium]|nr:GNAT family N-acetyltransferase [Parvularculaceae bacterium]
MTNDLTIRRLAGGDAGTVRALLALYGTAFELEAEYAEAPPSDAYLAEQLRNPATIMFVAEADGEVVGGLTAYELKKLEKARSEIYLYDLAVDAAWRRRGIATQLIKALQETAQAIGAWTIFVQADRDDPPAQALYAKLGKREDVCHFDIPPKS